ncbi:uncharacterized protein [Chelonus insularis]|uniref:uncharacterized protein n=1 Tax=Chelonus insularis TaxID=460826 RepID=UPI00158F285F|nr:uncharacterized protein LOC118067301 [Chelonus insularis]
MINIITRSKSFYQQNSDSVDSIKALIMNFLNVNKFNALTNDLSGNCFPVQSDDNQINSLQKFYSIGTFFYHVAYFVITFQGAISFLTLKTVHDSVITLMVSAEVIILTIHIQYHRHKYHSLITNFNLILNIQSDVLKDFIFNSVNPIVKVFKMYTFFSMSSIIIWAFMPIFAVFNKNNFTMNDFRLPIGFFNWQSFGIQIFLTGFMIQLVGCIYNGFKKAAINIYIVHFIALLIGQYLYLQYRLAAIFHNSTNEELMEELKQLLNQHRIVVKIAKEFPKLFFINTTITYINATLNFCVMGFMLLTMSGSYFERSLVATYFGGLFVEVYIMCASVDRLQELSVSITKEAFGEPWYNRELYIQKLFAIIMSTNMMECKLSTCGPINLSLINLKTVRILLLEFLF